MAGAKQSRGVCAFCGTEAAKGGMARHLAACPARMAAISKTDLMPGASDLLLHLRVQDADRSEYWLHLEMRGSASLETLDRYLRAIWLECCGHLSQFSIGGWTGREIGKKQKADNVFEPGVELIHIYDFGTSSETAITV